MYYLFKISLLFFALFSFSCLSQDNYKTITVDTITFTPCKKLPTHEGFDLSIQLKDTAKVEKIYLWKSKSGEYSDEDNYKKGYFYRLVDLKFKQEFRIDSVDVKGSKKAQKKASLRINIPNLEPNYVYDIFICTETFAKKSTDYNKFVNNKNLNETIIINKSLLQTEKYKRCKPTETVFSDTCYVVYSFLNTSNKKAWATDTRDKYAFDVGYLVTPLTNNFIVPAFGLQYYFRYYDDEERMKMVKSWSKFSHRFGPYIGFTNNSIARTGYRSDLFKNRSALFGVNFRLSNSIRLGAGSMVFYEESGNQILDNKKLTSSWYAGINLNLKLSNILSDASDLFKFISRPK